MRNHPIPWDFADESIRVLGYKDPFCIGILVALGIKYLTGPSTKKLACGRGIYRWRSHSIPGFWQMRRSQKVQCYLVSGLGESRVAKNWNL